MQRNYRKGVTLAEMCIVLAVVAIVSLSVASFATMAGGRGTAAATKLDAMGDLEIVEAIVESWILEAAKDYDIIVEPSNAQQDNKQILENNKLFSAEKGTSAVKDQIWLDGKTLTASFSGEGPILYVLKSITGLHFEAETAKEGGTVLYYCTVTYQYRNGIVTKQQTYTFCVYPRVGEIVSGTNSNTGGGDAGGASGSQ